MPSFVEFSKKSIINAEKHQEATNKGGRWLCGLCSESVKYEAGRGKRTPSPVGVEEAVRAHMAFCRTLRRGGPAERVAEGMCQMLRRTAAGKPRAAAASSLSRRTAAQHRASPPLSAGRL